MPEHAINTHLRPAVATYARIRRARTAHLVLPCALLVGASYALLRCHPDNLYVRAQFVVMVGVATALADELVLSIRRWQRTRRSGLVTALSFARMATRRPYHVLLSRIAAVCGVVGLANVVASGATDGFGCEVSLALTCAAAYLHVHFACTPAAPDITR